MDMFTTLLNSIPKNRLDYVEDLEIPDFTLTPYVCPDPYDYLPSRSDSILDSVRAFDRRTLSTASSIPLSRAMTDSEIDYGFYKRVELAEARRLYNEEWRRRMRTQFDDFYPYLPGDPGLFELQEAIRRLDMKVLDLKVCVQF
ncbi:hypothetical protein HF086_002707 [Spodoptera exigua]|uniref:Uncharacterized protein n=1 Tax=Spodoptera exigua TaxID=7107 RepID=A0A922SCT4_SPOEX|nr:hypothetical protein HF086_002707 [Spodoptera exigua]